MPDHHLHLKVGETAVETAQRRKLEPGSEFAIVKEEFRFRHRPFFPPWAYDEELFLGEGPRRIPMSEMARTLFEGGELSIMEVPSKRGRPRLNFSLNGHKKLC